MTTPIKTYTKKELRELYSVSATTWRAWVKPIIEKLGNPKGHIYNVAQVKIIFEHLGQP